MRLKISVLLAAAGLLLGASTASAFTGGYAGGGTGCSCHGTASGNVPVISGPTTLLPSETATYTASIAATLVGAGFNVATTAGTLTAAATGTGNDGNEVVHTQKNNGVFSYNFEVTAPAAMGPFDLMLAMLTYNDGAGAQGDIFNTTAATITVVPEPGTLLLVGGGLLGLAGLTTAARRRRP